MKICFLVWNLFKKRKLNTSLLYTSQWTDSYLSHLSWDCSYISVSTAGGVVCWTDCGFRKLRTHQNIWLTLTWWRFARSMLPDLFPLLWRRLRKVQSVTILGCPCHALFSEPSQLHLTLAELGNNNTMLKSCQKLPLLRGSTQTIGTQHVAAKQWDLNGHSDDSKDSEGQKYSK